ncbi:acyl carrier protein [Streptomyces olivaceus]|uniref:acyl carrier protein n=1 Tax=Streptomyces olivaceus TaxID=47716 RepID=UPI0036306642
MPATDIDDAAVATAVKEMLIAESRLTMSPGELSDDEPLNGELLRVSSLGFLGMLIRLEDALDVTLPDDLFTGKRFRVVSDVVDLVLRDCR